MATILAMTVGAMSPGRAAQSMVSDVVRAASTAVVIRLPALGGHRHERVVETGILGRPGHPGEQLDGGGHQRGRVALRPNRRRWG